VVDGKNMLRGPSIFPVPYSLFDIEMADDEWQMAGRKVDGWWLTGMT